jgi:sugar phosphate permease
MFFTGFVIDGSVVLINLATMETVSDSLSGSALGLATFSSQLCKTK